MGNVEQQLVVTKVYLKPYETGNLKAFADVVFNNSFKIKGIRLVETKEGKSFLAWPSREVKKGEYIDICFPTSKELTAHVYDAVMQEFKKAAADPEEYKRAQQSQSKGKFNKGKSFRKNDDDDDNPPF